MHPFNGIGIDIGSRHFHSRRKVDDHLVLWSWLPNIIHRITDFERKLEFGAGVGLWRIFIRDLGLWNGLFVL